MKRRARSFLLFLILIASLMVVLPVDSAQTHRRRERIMRPFISISIVMFYKVKLIRRRLE
jgi:hypothetical protein